MSCMIVYQYYRTFICWNNFATETDWLAMKLHETATQSWPYHYVHEKYICTWTQQLGWRPKHHHRLNWYPFSNWCWPITILANQMMAKRESIYLKSNNLKMDLTWFSVIDDFRLLQLNSSIKVFISFSSFCSSVVDLELFFHYVIDYII